MGSQQVEADQTAMVVLAEAAGAGQMVARSAKAAQTRRRQTIARSQMLPVAVRGLRMDLQLQKVGQMERVAAVVAVVVAVEFG